MPERPASGPAPAWGPTVGSLPVPPPASGGPGFGIRKPVPLSPAAPCSDDKLGMPRSVVSWKVPEKACTFDCLTLATNCSGVMAGRSGVAADDSVGRRAIKPMAHATATGASQRNLRARGEAGIASRVWPCYLKISSDPQAGSCLSKAAAMGAAIWPPTPPPSTSTAKATSPRNPMNQAWVAGGFPGPNSAVPVLP